MSIHTRLVLLVGCLLLLASCAWSGNPSAVHGVGTTPSMRTVTATPMPVLPVPTLGLVPRHCPLSHPTRQSISPKLAPVIGTSPAWATWPPDPNVFHPPPPSSLYPNSYTPPFGWHLMKVIWEVGPDYTHSVMIQGHDLFDHTPLYIQFLNDPPTADGVLDPQHPDHPVSVIGESWAEWGSELVVPKAGCYVMEVSWPMGQWSATFAVGA